MSSQEMLPCPFCGLEIPKPGWQRAGYVYPMDGHSSALWRAGCNEAAGGCTGEALGDTEDGAIAQWNRRAGARDDHQTRLSQSAYEENLIQHGAL
jgi:hypothetical protein